MNKVKMFNNHTMARPLCDKFRGDALRLFISGLKGRFTDVIFAAKPGNLPSALAWAQAVESNHERYVLAESFAKSQEEKKRKPVDWEMYLAEKIPILLGNIVYKV